VRIIVGDWVHPFWTWDVLEEHKVKSGIYVIRCLVNGKVYIGSAIDIRGRLSVHRSALNRNKHKNYRLQKAWNEYGSDQFVWEVLEYVYKMELLWVVEAEYIVRYKATERRFGFNSKVANGRPSEETIQKIREANLGRPCSELTRQKIAEGNRGRQRSEEERKKISEANRGKKRSEEQNRRNSEVRRGRKASEETKQKMSEVKLGKSRGEAFKQKMREAWVIRREKKREVKDG
jgi:group I intron endonuclease